MLTGDLNARTGSALDFVDTDHCIHVPGISLPQKQNLKRRKNYDSQINEHGKSLLEICKTCDLRIVNGRTSGDSFGRITCHSPKGISTVDYFIVSHEMLNLIGNFVVKEPTIFSDHSQLICWLNLFLPISAESRLINQKLRSSIFQNNLFGLNPPQKFSETPKTGRHSFAFVKLCGD